MAKDAADVVRRVVVLGGGSAGWISAARIAARHPATATGDSVHVTLIESATMPPVGVGEGTWPTMRNTLAKVGISETDFIRRSDGAFKQGARFVGWADGSAADAYYHPLNPPAGAGEFDLSPAWTAAGGAAPFADAVDFQSALCDAGLAPKAITFGEYGGAANYAYHLDAGKFASLLHDHAVNRLGVRHIVGDVIDVRQQENGDIRSLLLGDGTELEGDLFIDCSGFRGRLIGDVYGVGLRPCSHILFADRALAMQIPYAEIDAPIACHTISTAQDAGWIWDIGLWARRGTGFVYSSAHIDDEQAERVLRKYVGPQAETLAARKLNINAGYREVFWRNNCVAVGLSAGFIEPLEASALMLIEIAMDSVADRLPRTRAAMDVMASQFNAAFDHHWGRIIEFLKLHYALSRRTSPFWRDNVDPASWPDDLKERLSLWREHPPAPQDFSFSREVFSWPSYQYVLHGMGFPTDYQVSLQPADRARADRLFERVARQRQDALSKMPTHRRLLTQIYDHGLQAV